MLVPLQQPNSYKSTAGASGSISGRPLTIAVASLAARATEGSTGATVPIGTTALVRIGAVADTRTTL